VILIVGNSGTDSANKGTDSANKGTDGPSKDTDGPSKGTDSARSVLIVQISVQIMLHDHAPLGRPRLLPSAPLHECGGEPGPGEDVARG
jgi:hypothetical protein